MLLLFEMENYEEGDLTDIVRGGSSRSRSTTRSSTSHCKTELGDQDEDQDSPFYSSSQDNNYNPQWSSSQFSSQLLLLQDHHHHHHHQYSFGDPFCSTVAASLDLHQELDNTNNNTFFNGITTTTTTSTQDELIKTPSSSNIFSRMLQISPSPDKFPTISSLNSSSNFLIPNHSLNSPTTPHSDHLHHFLHHNDNNPSPSALHISSPRNPPGIKRRKSQARKVVCVPAPVAASSRPNGEVIPSDLWAWRKYGQKPIKGSPYPRGYYRCSSSKGCSARKQVERSRTDPNMLVITYTSEHNHPWPTQRNALAGSSRSQQSKNNNITTTTSSTSTTTPTPNSSKLSQDHHHKNKEEKEEHQDQNNGTLLSAAATTTSNNNNNVKEEETENHHHQSMMSEGFDDDHDFFADLEELETDPLTLLFTTQQPLKLDQIKESATTTPTTTTGCLHDVVPFNNLFDWPPPPLNNNSTPFHEQPPPTTPTNGGFY